MKRFLTKLIIFALFLTAPLSFTGDRCPDFKPDYCRSKYIAEAITVAVSQQRIAPRKTYLSGLQPVYSAAAGSVLTFIAAYPQQYILGYHLGRAPPQQHSVSA